MILRAFLICIHNIGRIVNITADAVGILQNILTCYYFLSFGQFTASAFTLMLYCPCHCWLLE